MKATESASHHLRLAARLWGLQTGYTAVGGKSVEAPRESIAKLLEEISGMPAKTDADHAELIRVARDVHAKKCLEPVNIVWCQGAATDVSSHILATIPCDWLKAELYCRIELELGESKEIPLFNLKPIRIIDGKRARVRIPVPPGLPHGYHRISLSAQPDLKAYLFVAPVKAYEPRHGEKTWGGFAPLYGIRSEGNWGIGDLTDLVETQAVLKEFGGDFFGTLPILASESEGDDYDPSPYSPISRLFWNEIFLDVETLAVESQNTAAQALISSADFQKSLEKLRSAKTVDYPAVFALKKKILLILADAFFALQKDKSREFENFLRANPLAGEYAEFRAKGDESLRQYHLYVQYQFDCALALNSEEVKQGEVAGLYLDFPVGVSRGGFDSKKFASSFVLKATVGAPPDGLFPSGQNWGFAPLHPLQLREQGYDYFIRCVRHHMRYAKILRLDHIMGLYRIYVIPEGASPKAGSYIRYFSHEFFAVLAIESHRAKVQIIGENLGTVSGSVQSLLKEHGLLGMWVLPFEAGDKPADATLHAPVDALACLNTHDMVPFAGHLNMRDLKLFESLKVIESESAVEQIKNREASLKKWMKNLRIKKSEELFQKLTRTAAIGPSKVLLINLEDLWEESEPQNIPGTWKEYPNWRRKLAWDIEAWSGASAIQDLLDDVTRLRKAIPSERDNDENSDKNSDKNPDSGAISGRKRPPSLQ
jgi:4-alpha-glucanotransferase